MKIFKLIYLGAWLCWNKIQNFLIGVMYTILHEVRFPLTVHLLNFSPETWINSKLWTSVLGCSATAMKLSDLSVSLQNLNSFDFPHQRDDQTCLISKKLMLHFVPISPTNFCMLLSKLNNYLFLHSRGAKNSVFPLSLSLSRQSLSCTFGMLIRKRV